MYALVLSALITSRLVSSSATTTFVTSVTLGKRSTVLITTRWWRDATWSYVSGYKLFCYHHTINCLLCDAAPQFHVLKTTTWILSCFAPAALYMTCDAPTDCRCPDTQVYRSCGSACNSTCDDRFPMCTEQCVPRCECPADAPFLNDSTTCIAEDECPGKCPSSTTARRASPRTSVPVSARPQRQHDVHRRGRVSR